MIGTASRSVRFDWRKSPASFALIGSELLERNNFGSTRLGVLARMPIGGFIGEVGITRAFTWSTDSSDKLALTPWERNVDGWRLLPGSVLRIIRWGDIRFAIAICLDIEVPSLAARMSELDLDLVLVPSMTSSRSFPSSA